ncbi:MAG: 50S ribosomal protein L9 [Deltaproteobacteria bacterium]|nr:50S ribosomal protein L9 [Deltaproteobacteria bacterium]
MEVILTDDIVGVGDVGEKVNVKPGYARNFLFPRGLAFETSTRRATEVVHRMKQVEAKKKQLKVAAQKVAEDLRSVVIELGLRVGAGGRVFGSISSRDIAEKLQAGGYEIDRRRVILAEHIKKVGIHYVKVKLHAEVDVQIKINIAQLAATKEEEEKAALELKERMEARKAEEQSEEIAGAKEGAGAETEVKEDKAPKKAKGKKKE